MIIDKTKPPSPILTYKPKPDFKNDLEKIRYWEKQKEYWLNGKDGVPGTLVHKTQEQKIKNRNTGELLRPICRDVDLMIHEEIQKSREAEEALVIVKGRGIGLSTDFGCLGNYFMRVYPGSTSLFTSADQPKVSALFSDKVMTTFNEYDADIRPFIERKNETKSTAFLRAEIKSKNKEGKEFLAYSEIYCRETADTDANASAFSGKGCIFGAYDELFLHKRRDMLLRSSASCFVEQSTGRSVAFLLSGGTVEDVLTNEELHQLQKMIVDVETTGRLGTLPARLLFIPAWWGKFMVNGHSNEKKAREWWDKEVEALSKLEDTTAVRAFKMNNPMSKEDIFDLAAGSFFEEDVMEKIKLQLDTVTKKEVLEVPHNITIIGDRIEALPNATGKILIAEHPKDAVDYILTVDGVASGKDAGNEEGSKVASIIWKLFDPSGLSYCPVALYYERPKKVEQSYIYSTNLCRYYNKFGNFKKIAAEGNASTGDHFSTFLEKEGLGSWILMRKDVSGKGTVNTSKYFQYVTNDIRDWQVKQMNIILRKYIGNINMKTVLRDWLKGVNENADIRDSSLMLPIYTGADFDKVVVKTKVVKQKRPRLKFINGRSVTVWE